VSGIGGPEGAVTVAPLFTVVIPTYNQADYLKEAIDSVLAQSFAEFEIIVVNNHSTDNTRGVIEEFHDPRIKAIDFSNEGVIGAGRNVGIRAAKGDYVCFLDSDDTWYPEKLAEVAQVIQEDPEIGLICHNQDMVRDGVVEQQTNYGPPSDYTGKIYDYVLGASNGPSTSATTVSRSVLEDVSGFSEDRAFITVEDYELWLRLAKVCRFHFIDSVLGTHMYHGESSSNNAERLLNGGLAVLDQISTELDHPTEKLSAEDNRRRHRAVRYHRANAYYVAGRNYQRRGEFKKPLEYFGRTLRVYPLHRKAIMGLSLLLTDRLLGLGLRRRLTGLLWGRSWRWG